MDKVTILIPVYNLKSKYIIQAILCWEIEDFTNFSKNYISNSQIRNFYRITPLIDNLKMIYKKPNLVLNNNFRIFVLNNVSALNFFYSKLPECFFNIPQNLIDKDDVILIPEFELQAIEIVNSWKKFCE